MDVYEDIDSPIGRLRLIASDNALVAIWFEHGRDAARGAAGLTRGSNAIIERTRRQLEEYFAGQRREFDLPLEAARHGVPAPRLVPSQAHRVWRHHDLRRTGRGARKFEGLARRGTGQRQQSDPHRHSLPSRHRADGSLTGFGGGLPIKAQLLELERAATQPRLL
jgi:methylated-DNA-[protein]-cysteine S-methyltransferase